MISLLLWYIMMTVMQRTDESYVGCGFIDRIVSMVRVGMIVSLYCQLEAMWKCLGDIPSGHVFGGLSKRVKVRKGDTS